jgi:CRP-like cAMP-binding protein
MLVTEKAKPLFKDDVIEGRRLHYYDKGETIPLVAGGVWQVYRGVAQLSQVSGTGEEILLGWAQPGHVFGLWLTYMEGYQAKALSEIYLRWYNLTEIESSPQLTQTMLNQVTRRIRQTEAILAIAGLRRVEDRLLQLLKLLKQEMGESLADERSRISIRLTHQNIANAIGTTRVTVTRLLGEFQRQDIITIDNERHIIL